MTEEFFEYKGYRIPVKLVEKTGAGPDTFDEISSWHIDALQKTIGINANNSIVEIGCGIGRDAIPLSNILSNDGNYLGTDVIQESIEWCQNNIAARNPNFKFVWHNISDDLHNPAGELRAENIRLEKDDQSTDLVIMQSVFTHMFENEIVHYLKEFKRILRPTGRVWTSVFVVNPQILEHVGVHAPTTYALSFKHPYGNGCYVNAIESARGAVAFTREAIDRMVHAAGLKHAREPLRGSWSGVWSNPEFGQDALILQPA